MINTNYSTLQDAWGDDFIIKKKSVKKTQRKDPLCELYAHQYKKKVFPYTDRPRKSKTPKYPTQFTLNQEDYDKYYGYQDARQYSRTRKALKDSNSNNVLKTSYTLNDNLDKQYVYSIHENPKHVNDYQDNYMRLQKKNNLSSSPSINKNRSNTNSCDSQSSGTIRHYPPKKIKKKEVRLKQLHKKMTAISDIKDEKFNKIKESSRI